MITVHLKPKARAAYAEALAATGVVVSDEFTGPVYTNDAYAKRDALAGIIVFANGGETSETFAWADILRVEGEVE